MGTPGKLPRVRMAMGGRLRLTLRARSADAKLPGHGVSCAQLLITQAALPESPSHHPGYVPREKQLLDSQVVAGSPPRKGVPPQGFILFLLIFIDF